ncbi:MULTISPECIES: YdcF family protein [Brochothrix]|uniref:DUF218 domain-containing protein n=1 Tax=Brochothrix thermosphacta TaxID=2756 RepID=A0A1D2LUT9_BROTH|nr:MULTISPECIES: YdcF family protein [Brochothrix]SLN01423.1 Integral membrane protein [Brachybacterium faecium]ANZ98441.1 hypothetical protein BFC20_12425 [Brochothrix thermosphacta]ATF25623.1 hypothetical protein CNY62_04020 [Brochothrix thermosphacta]ATH84967.1 hypothetical protein CPF12_03645 [Brochothrix thermosphacta]MBR5525503.1 YdcF family protein [Brochothrix sp.]
MFAFLITGLGFVSLFFIFNAIDNRRVSNSILLTIGLFILLFGLVSIWALDDLNTKIIYYGFIGARVFVILIGVALILNGLVVIKKEGRTLPNILSLAFGLVLIIFISITFTERFLAAPSIQRIYAAFILIVGYYIFIFFNCFISAMIYQLNRPRLNQDFIIVLGCGLNGDKVTPLLASRLNTAKRFYLKQKHRTTPPLIIVSGGQGPDELVAEATAMKHYLIEQGIPEKHLIIEDKSTTTEENLRFSKKIMDGLKDTYSSIFVTNNYHTFRAGIFAKRVHLDSGGIGAHTAPYYLPTAFVREYIAILMLHKWLHLCVTILLIALLIFA